MKYIQVIKSLILAGSATAASYTNTSYIPSANGNFIIDESSNETAIHYLLHLPDSGFSIFDISLDSLASGVTFTEGYCFYSDNSEVSDVSAVPSNNTIDLFGSASFGKADAEYMDCTFVGTLESPYSDLYSAEVVVTLEGLPARLNKRVDQVFSTIVYASNAVTSTTQKLTSTSNVSYGTVTTISPKTAFETTSTSFSTSVITPTTSSTENSSTDSCIILPTDRYPAGGIITNGFVIGDLDGEDSIMFDMLVPNTGFGALVASLEGSESVRIDSAVAAYYPSENTADYTDKENSLVFLDVEFPDSDNYLAIRLKGNVKTDNDKTRNYFVETVAFEIYTSTLKNEKRENAAETTVSTTTVVVTASNPYTGVSSTSSTSSKSPSTSKGQAISTTQCSKGKCTTAILTPISLSTVTYTAPLSTTLYVESCFDNKCTNVPHVTGVTLVTEGEAVHTTYCPLTETTVGLPLFTSIYTVPLSTTVYVESCVDKKCTKVPHITGYSLVTKGETVYTTYCPLTGITLVPPPDVTVITIEGDRCYYSVCSSCTPAFSTSTTAIVPPFSDIYVVCSSCSSRVTPSVITTVVSCSKSSSSTSCSITETTSCSTCSKTTETTSCSTCIGSGSTTLYTVSTPCDTCSVSVPPTTSGTVIFEGSADKIIGTSFIALIAAIVPMLL